MGRRKRKGKKGKEKKKDKEEKQKHKERRIGYAFYSIKLKYQLLMSNPIRANFLNSIYIASYLPYIIRHINRAKFI